MKENVHGLPMTPVKAAKLEGEPRAALSPRNRIQENEMMVAKASPRGAPTPRIRRLRPRA